MTDITIKTHEETLTDSSTVYDVIVSGEFFEGENVFPACSKADAKELSEGLYDLFSKHTTLGVEFAD